MRSTSEPRSRGAFHGRSRIPLSETETRKNLGIRRQRTTEKVHPGMRWRHRKRCVWRHVRTSEPKEKQERGTSFPSPPTAKKPGGLLDNSNTLESPCKNFYFRQRKNIEKGHRKSVASRHRQHHTQGAFPGTYARMHEGCKATAPHTAHQKPLPKAYRNTSPLVKRSPTHKHHRKRQCALTVGGAVLALCPWHVPTHFGNILGHCQGSAPGSCCQG